MIALFIFILLLNNIVLAYVFKMVLDWKLIRIVEGLIAQTSRLISKGTIKSLDNAEIINCISDALNKSCGKAT